MNSASPRGWDPGMIWEAIGGWRARQPLPIHLFSLGQRLTFGGSLPFCLWNTFPPLLLPSQASQVQPLPLNLKRKMKRDCKDRWQLPFTWIPLFSERNFRKGPSWISPVFLKRPNITGHPALVWHFEDLIRALWREWTSRVGAILPCSAELID